jgi:hypothetical protein
VNIDDMVAKAASFIGIQLEKRPPVGSFGFEEVTNPLRRSKVEMDFLRQVMTSWGALSSACE